MSRTTGIDWCDSTVNPVSGCGGCELWDGEGVRLCSAGIQHEQRLAPASPLNYAPRFSEVRLLPGRVLSAAGYGDLTGTDRPGKPWLNGRPRHIVISDMGEALSDEVGFGFLREEVLGAVRSRRVPRHVWLWSTKRPRRMAEFSDWLWEEFGEVWPDNLVAMTSVSCQRTAEARIEWLLKVPAKWRGLICEPLTTPVDLGAWLRPKDLPFPSIDWVIAGGARGAAARPMEPEAPRLLRDACQCAGVPFFFTGFGAFCSVRDASGLAEDGAFSHERLADGTLMLRAGKKAAGRVLDGRTWDEMPRFGIEVANERCLLSVVLGAH